MTGISRVVGYIRVSTKEQATEGVSLAAQRAKIEGYVQYRGFELVALVADEGISASKPFHTRPGGGEVLDYISKGEAEGVVACKLDRLFRDALDCLEVTRDWDRAGIHLHLLDISLDTATPYGRFFITVIASFAELERNMIAERVVVGLQQVKAEGCQLGAPAYGQTRLPTVDTNGRREMSDLPEEAAFLPRILELRRCGLSYQKVADQLNLEGVPTKKGGPWLRNTVRRICLREDSHQ